MIKVPKNWQEVSVKNFVMLKTLDKEQPSVFRRQIELLSILTDTYSEDEVWEDLDIEELHKMILELSWLRKEPSKTLKKQIGLYHLKDINSLTLGEFIDLEYYFTNGVWENLPNILGVLYRKNRLDEFGNRLIEKHGSYNLQERAEYFNTCSINEVFGIFEYFIDFKALIYEGYENLFQPIFDEEEVDEDYIPDEEEQAAIKEEQIFNKWAWESILYKLSGGDITKYDTLLELGVIFVFNTLAFIKETRK